MIRFINPSFLFALLLLVIPILIHLFNFRRFKKVYFTNVRFLQELKEETTRLSRLKHLLVLASRILALTFLVLAFAQPIIPVGRAAPISSAQSLSIYIDNSFSMEGLTREGTLLDVARRKAKEIALAFPPSSKIQLLTNDFQSVHQRFMNRDEFLDELERVKISPVSRMISEVVERQEEALNRENGKVKKSFLVSDFQSSTSDFDKVKNDSSLQLNVIALPVQSASNIFIDSCWLETPVIQLNKPVNLFVKLKNSGEKDSENTPVRLLLNGSQRAVASSPVGAGQSTTITMNFSVANPGLQRVEVQITDQPITFDDSYFLSFDVKEKLKITSINGKVSGPYLPALFGKDAFFQFTDTSASQVDYTLLAQQDLVILNEIPEISSGLSAEILKYIKSGGSIVVFPDSNAVLNSYSALLSGDILSSPLTSNDKVENIDLKHPLFTDVFDNNRKADGSIDYPVTLKHFPLSKNASGRIVLMKLQSGDPLLAEYKMEKGTVYFFSVPLNPGFSNLARHAMIVPVLYKMALLSVRQPAISYTLGRETPLLLDRVNAGSDEAFHLVNRDLKTDLIPSHRVTPYGLQISTGGEVKQAGIYDLNNNQTTLAALAFNYDRKESLLSYLSSEEIERQASSAHIKDLQFFKPGSSDLTKTLNQIAEGISLWKYCIILALVFLLIETLILRYWKTT